MNYKQVIEVSGRLSADVFSLPCVRGCLKNNDDSVTYVLWISSLRHFGENTVTTGQRLCEAEAMGRCVTLLLSCDMLILDGGWMQSKGCELEMRTAEIYGIESLRLKEVFTEKKIVKL